MAKRISDRRFKREKKTRISRTEEYLINTRYLGEEPQYTGEVLSDMDLTKAYNWYSYMCKASDARDYIVDYMEHIGKSNIARLAKQIPDGRVPTTAGWLCRILMLGGKITDRSKTFLLDRITRAIQRTQENEMIEAEKPERQPVDVHASIRERARDIIGDVESMIDNKELLDMYDYLQKKSIPPVYAQYIAEYYQKMVTELEQVQASNDEDLNFAYRQYSKQRVAKLLIYYRNIVAGAEKFGDVAKRVRKANRKPRTVSVEKTIRLLKFQKNDQEYKLVSIDPQQILSAQELWTFNTKTRMLTVYRAEDLSGLGVKTVNITGFNESTSISMRLRKPEGVLQKVLTGGKVVLRELMDALTTRQVPAKARLTSETILLRVVK